MRGFKFVFGIIWMFLFFVCIIIIIIFVFCCVHHYLDDEGSWVRWAMRVDYQN